MLNHIKINR